MATIGIDAVDIARFESWVSFPSKKLSRIFTSAEQEYILSLPEKAAERFAARFAAKEAAYKALFPLLPQPMPFLSVAPLITILSNPSGQPILIIDWQALRLPETYRAQLSLSHTATTAFAVVIIEHQQYL